uniref:Uncharacterized protein n=1 Tax=Amazona collaria TaxID=241587 RepID=A0A8B9FHS8_9PSIT
WNVRVMRHWHREAVAAPSLTVLKARLDTGAWSKLLYGRCPCRGRGDLNYTSLVFPGKGHGPQSTTDYVNVDPEKRKADFWPCSSPMAAKCVEYTEVKL